MTARCPQCQQVCGWPRGACCSLGAELLGGGAARHRDTGGHWRLCVERGENDNRSVRAAACSPRGSAQGRDETSGRITLFKDRSRARGACGGCCGVSVVLVLWARRSPSFLLGSALCLQSVRENGGSHELPRGVRMREFSGCISSMRYKRAAAHLKRVAKLRPPRPGAEPAAELLRGGSAPHTALSGALSALSPSADRKSPQVSVAAFRRCRGDAARALPEAWWVGGRAGWRSRGPAGRPGGTAALLSPAGVRVAQRGAAAGGGGAGGAAAGREAASGGRAGTAAGGGRADGESRGRCGRGEASGRPRGCAVPGGQSRRRSLVPRREKSRGSRGSGGGCRRSGWRLSWRG